MARVHVLYYLGASLAERNATLDEAEAALAGQPVGDAAIELAIEPASKDYLAARDEGVVAWVDAAGRLGQELGSSPPAKGLTLRGGVQSSHGDPSGLADLRQVIELATQQGTFRDAVVASNDLAEGLRAIEGAESALSGLDEGRRLAERSANLDFGIQLGLTRIEILRDLGRWDALLEDAAEFVSTTAMSYGHLERMVSVLRESVLVWRGDPSGALAREAEFLSEAESGGEMQVHAWVYAMLCHAHVIAGDVERAGALLGELLDKPLPRDGWIYAAHTPTLGRAAIAASREDLAEQLLEGVDRKPPAARVAIELTEAHLLEAGGLIEEAAAAYAGVATEIGPFSRVELGQAFLGHGRCLCVLHDPSARGPLEEARRVFVGLSAVPYVGAVDVLLAETVAGRA